MAIRIPVSAEFDDDGLKQQLGEITRAFNQLGAEAAKVSGVKFQPISKASVDEARKMRQEFEVMLRISGGLRRTLANSGQGGKPWQAIDWQQVFHDANQRQQYARTLANRLREGSVTGHAPVPPAPGGRPAGGAGAGAGVGAAVGGIAQAGLRAAGPVGGVAAGALGTGMKSGFGAGLAGLVGGIAAMGVGKLVGGVANKIGDAQDEAIGYDKLKRSLGDVGVSFDALRSTVRAAGDDIGVAFNEAARLGGEFAKLANLSSDQRGETAGGVALGGGMSRALGLDPAQGVGFLGGMRGMRLTQDEQSSRKLALLIGETIGKSDAFAKSGEVLDAIGGFVTAQTRSTLGRAPVEGYAGQFAGLVGSGIPGMDPTGAAAVLGRVIQTLAQGGGKGEASQFFGAGVAQQNGLSPIAGKLWQQNPMATISEVFAPDSAVGRYYTKNGLPLPTGNQTNYDAQLGKLRAQYGSDPLLLLNATANHLGVNESQAAALLGTAPAAVGGMTKRLGRLGVDLGSLKGNSIGLLGQIEAGDRSKLGGVANDLLGRTGKGRLTVDEARDLKAALAGPDDEKLRNVLATLAAQYGQAETDGSRTRDTIAGVGNILQDYASKSLPLLSDSRAALMGLAGKQLGVGPQGIRESMITAESGERAEAVRGKYGALIEEQDQRIIDARMSETGLVGREYADAAERSRNTQNDARAKIQELKRQRDEELAAEEARRGSELQKSRADAAAQRELLDKAREREAGTKAPSTGAGVSGSLLSAVIAQESGGRHRNGAGGLTTSPAGARGIAQIMPGTGGDPGYGVRPLQDDSEAEHRRFARDYLDAMLREFGGDRHKALAAYNAGPGRVKGAVRKHGDNWLQSMPEETRNYVPSVLDREQQGTQMPADARAAERNAAASREVSVAPLSGEMQLNLGLSAEARRLLEGPAIMPSTRIQSNFYRNHA